MSLTRLLALAVLLCFLTGVLAVGVVHSREGRLPLLVNERGGPPIARWRVHAKGLERLPQARSKEFIVKYCRAAQLKTGESVVLTMVTSGRDLISAARLFGVQSRLAELQEMLRGERRARELVLIGTGPQTRIIAIWPPPGYFVRSSVRKKRAE